VIKKLKKDNLPLISVIVPIHKKDKKIADVRKSILQSNSPIEVFYIIDKNLSTIFKKIGNFEKIIKVKNKGRGYMLAEGVRCSNGEITVFLHSDTTLPNGWDKSIRRSFEDKKVIGGCFKLKFDIESIYLDMAIKLLILNANRLKILTGDRAQFVRSSLIKNNITILEIPIMEDLELAFLMKKNGDVIILNDTVITSAFAFIKNGVFRHSIRILICYFWYRVGGNLQDIYNYYYSKNDKSK
jgi:glycosyltransferase involved in cell wall biosynthesis